MPFPSIVKLVEAIYSLQEKPVLMRMSTDTMKGYFNSIDRVNNITGVLVVLDDTIGINQVDLRIDVAKEEEVY
jgi:hypothetical protein